MKLKANRPVNEIIVHCTATKEGDHFTVGHIREWHLDRGWKDIGYHFVVYLDGTVHVGRPLDRKGAHVRGRNAGTIAIVYVGGLDRKGRPKDTRTTDQKVSIRTLLQDLLIFNPSITRISGHNQYANKACPCFDADAEYRNVDAERLAQVDIPIPEEDRDEYLVIATRSRRGGNIRRAPSTKHEIVGTYPENTLLKTTGGLWGDWIEVIVDHDKRKGWVHTTIVEDVE